MMLPGFHFLARQYQYAHSVVHVPCFRKAFSVASLSAAIAAVLRITLDVSLIPPSTVADNVNSTGYSAFLWFCGTLLVFRTSQSYGRFWEGTTLVHQMIGHWTDMTTVVFGFTTYSQQDPTRIRLFKHTLVRLISLMNAMILADLEGFEEGSANAALHFELLDVEGFDSTALQHLKRSQRSHLTPLMIYQWLNNLIVAEISSGVLCIPAPLLTRVFQAMNQAMLSYHDARKYSSTPFPFPYTAAIEIVLMVHFILTPLVVCSWDISLPGVVCFTFFLVFLMWLLHLVPTDLENPFNVKFSGLDTEKLQTTMNEILLDLISEPMDYCPRMNRSIELREAEYFLLSRVGGCSISPVQNPQQLFRRKSFCEVFDTTGDADNSGPPSTARTLSFADEMSLSSAGSQRRRRDTHSRKGQRAHTHNLSFLSHHDTALGMPVEGQAPGFNRLVSFHSGGGSPRAESVATCATEEMPDNPPFIEKVRVSDQFSM